VPLGKLSICDGLMARRPGIAPFAAVTLAGIGAMTVSDGAVRRAMKSAAERLKLVFEPSGAAALAALLEGSLELDGRNVLVIASGGNVSLADFSRHISDA